MKAQLPVTIVLFVAFIANNCVAIPRQNPAVDTAEASLLQQVSAWMADNHVPCTDIAASPWVNKLTTRFVLSHQIGFPNWYDGSIFVMGGGWLSDTLYSNMVAPQVQVKENYYRGLGWGIVKGLPGSEYALEHGGSDIGVRTMSIFLPASKSGIVVMTNGDNGMFVYDQAIRRALPAGGQILDIMNKGTQAHERITLPGNVIAVYTGVYMQPNGKSMVIVKEGNAIKVSGEGLPTAVLFPETTTKFFLLGFDVQLEFGAAGTADAGTVAIFENGKQVMKIKKANSLSEKN